MKDISLARNKISIQRLLTVATVVFKEAPYGH